MKKLMTVLVVLAMLFALAGCGGEKKPVEKKQAAAPEVVNIGIQTLVTPELLMREKGVYEKYLGCKVNMVMFNSGADVNRAFASKSIDIGMIGTSPAAIGISTNLGYEVFWFADVIGAAETLVAKKDSGIKTVKDLEGKKVATPFASTAHFSLQNAMSLSGVDPAKVKLFDMQPNDIYAAWTRGDIDAAYVWDPVLSKLFADGGISITDSAELAKKGIVTADLIVINKEFATKYPNIAKGFIKAQVDAVNTFNKDKKAAVAKLAKTLDIKPEVAEAQVKGFIYPDGKEQLTDKYFGKDGKGGNIAGILKQSADFLVKQGSIKSAPDMSVFKEYSTGEFIVRAINE